MKFKEYLKRHSNGRRIAFTGDDQELRAGRRVSVRETGGAEFSFRVKRSVKERRQRFLPAGGRIIETTDNRIALFLPGRKIYRLEFFKDRDHLFTWVMQYLRRLAAANQVNDDLKAFVAACMEFDVPQKTRIPAIKKGD